MTIAVAVKTGSSVVFAADSKTTTGAIAGYEQDGSPRWVEQTYDNATKVVCDRSKALMKHGYPPDKQEKATKTVLEQAEDAFGEMGRVRGRHVNLVA